MHRNTSITTLLLTTGLAQAGVSQHNNRADFDAATGSQSVEDFESESLGQFFMPTFFDSGLGADLYTGAVSSLIEAGDPEGYGLFNTTTGGRKYLRMGQRQVSVADQTGSYGVEFTFGGQVHGFGFDVSGFQPNFGAGGFNISLFLDGQMVEDFFVFSDQIFGDVRFYGFTRDGRFDTARVFVPVLNFGNNEADYLAFDDVTWSVPSPAGLSALALVGLAAARRRRA